MPCGVHFVRLEAHNSPFVMTFAAAWDARLHRLTPSYVRLQAAKAQRKSAESVHEILTNFQPRRGWTAEEEMLWVKYQGKRVSKIFGNIPYLGTIKKLIPASESVSGTETLLVRSLTVPHCHLDHLHAIRSQSRCAAAFKPFASGF